MISKDFLPYLISCVFWQAYALGVLLIVPRYFRGIVDERKVGVFGFVMMWVFPPVIWYRLLSYVFRRRLGADASLSGFLAVVFCCYAFVMFGGWMGAFGRESPTYATSVAQVVWFLIPACCTWDMIVQSRYFQSSEVMRRRLQAFGTFTLIVASASYGWWTWQCYWDAKVLVVDELRLSANQRFRAELPGFESFEKLGVVNPTTAHMRLELWRQGKAELIEVGGIGNDDGLPAGARALFFKTVPEDGLEAVLKADKRIELSFPPGTVSQVYIAYYQKRSARNALAHGK